MWWEWGSLTREQLCDLRTKVLPATEEANAAAVGCHSGIWCRSRFIPELLYLLGALGRADLQPSRLTFGIFFLLSFSFSLLIIVVTMPCSLLRADILEPACLGLGSVTLSQYSSSRGSSSSGGAWGLINSIAVYLESGCVLHIDLDNNKSSVCSASCSTATCPATVLWVSPIFISVL